MYEDFLSLTFFFGVRPQLIEFVINVTDLRV
jgi:hypothetical protein